MPRIASRDIFVCTSHTKRWNSRLCDRVDSECWRVSVLALSEASDATIQDPIFRKLVVSAHRKLSIMFGKSEFFS